MRPAARRLAGISSGMSHPKLPGATGERWAVVLSRTLILPIVRQRAARGGCSANGKRWTEFSHVPIVQSAGRIKRLGRLDKSPAFSIVRVFRFLLLHLMMLIMLLTAPAYAACTGIIADRGPRLWRAAAGEKAATLTYLGHASFLIESPRGCASSPTITASTGAKVTPDIVTMNNAHQSHYSDYIEPGVKFVLRGWDPGGGVANHNLQYRDVRVNNVPTNVRGFGERATTATRSSCSTSRICASRILAICTTC